MRTWIIVPVLTCLLASGCTQKGLDNKFSGTLEMTEHQLGARVTGRVAALFVREGDSVKAGQMVAALDRADQAEMDFNRLQALFQQGGADQQAVEHARLDMDDQRVVSPIDGVVLVKVHELGETVAAGTPIVVVGDLKDQWVKVFIPEGTINRIRMGQKAALSFDGLGRTYQGHVSYIATKAEFTPRNVQTPEERVTQAFAVKVAVDDPDLQAHPGVAVDVKLEQ